MAGKLRISNIIFKKQYLPIKTAYLMQPILTTLCMTRSFACSPIITILNNFAHLSRLLYSSYNTHPVLREWIGRKRVACFFRGEQLDDHRPSVIAGNSVAVARQEPILQQSFKRHRLKRICETRKFKLIHGGIDRKVHDQVQFPCHIMLFCPSSYCIRNSNKQNGVTGYVALSTNFESR